MTAIAALLPDLEAAIASLHDAIQAASTQWEAPLLEPEGPTLRGDEGSATDAWTPRDAAEHATFGLALNVEFAAQSEDSRVSSTTDFAAAWMARFRAGEIDAPSMSTAASASAALAAVQGKSFDALRRLPDDALALPVEFMPGQEDYLVQRGVPNAGDVATALRLSVTHLHDHADQIRRAVTPP